MLVNHTPVRIAASTVTFADRAMRFIPVTVIDIAVLSTAADDPRKE